MFSVAVAVARERRRRRLQRRRRAFHVRRVSSGRREGGGAEDAEGGGAEDATGATALGPATLGTRGVLGTLGTTNIATLDTILVRAALHGAAALAPKLARGAARVRR